MTTMNLEISESTATQLSVLKGKMLMRDNQLYKITDYEIEEVTTTPKKSWYNSNPQPKTRKILKSIRIIGYNDEGQFLGTFTESVCRRLITYFGLYYMRNTWVKFQEALNAFGFEINEIKKGE